MLWFLNKGDGKEPAEYKLEPLAGKKEITVAVLVSTNPSLTINSAENAGLDRELAHVVSTTLSNESKGIKVPIRCVDAARMNQIRTGNPTLWDTGGRGELATKLGADYVIEVYVNSFVLDNREYGSEVTVGRAALTVNVYKAGRETEPVYSYPIDRKPEMPDTRNTNRQLYRTLYIQQLGEQIARKHVIHLPDRDRRMTR